MARYNSGQNRNITAAPCRVRRSTLNTGHPAASSVRLQQHRVLRTFRAACRKQDSKREPERKHQNAIFKCIT